MSSSRPTVSGSVETLNTLARRCLRHGVDHGSSWSARRVQSRSQAERTAGTEGPAPFSTSRRRSPNIDRSVAAATCFCNFSLSVLHGMELINAVMQS